MTSLLRAAPPTLIDKVQQAVLARPSTAVNFVADSGATEETTLGEFIRGAEVLSDRLRRTSLVRGDLVAIRGGGGSRAVCEAIIACALSGLVAVPLVSLLGDSDVDTIIDLGGVRALLAESAIKGRDLTSHLRRLRRDRSELVVGGIGDLRSSADYQLSDLRAEPWEVDWDEVTDESLAFVLFSSGTTGQPKGVMHSYSTVFAEVLDFADQLDVLHGGHLLQPFPLGHIGGVVGLFISAVLGRDMTILNSWNAAIALDVIDRYRVTGSGSSPFFIQTLLDERERRGKGMESIRALESGGGRVGRELVLRAETMGLHLSPAYGSTEHPTAAGHHADDTIEKRSSSDGYPMNGSQIRIVGPDGEQLPAGEDGEVLLSGPEQFIGYLSGDSSYFVDEKWFRTGDIGRMAPDGALTITGRIKEIIIRGGENISTSEVEQILLGHPSIAEAAVVGVADIKFGERAHAYIVQAPGSPPVDLDEVRRYFDERRVARYKTPEFLTIVSELPRNGMGKVQKHLLTANG